MINQVFGTIYTTYELGKLCKSEFLIILLFFSFLLTLFQLYKYHY